jgi:putative effector of murein hydrolase
MSVLVATLLALGLTVLGYVLGLAAARATNQHPLANPVLIGAVVVAGVLWAASVPYARYADGAGLLRWLLGPAITAMALPIWRLRHSLRAQAVPILRGLVIGTLAGAALGYAGGRLLGLSEPSVMALATKSVTSPFAIAVMDRLGGPADLAAVVVIVTGIIGAILLPPLFNLAGIRNPVARGLGYGIAAHIVGTQRATAEDATAGALAGLAMALAGVLTAVALPLAWPWLFR